MTLDRAEVSATRDASAPLPARTHLYVAPDGAGKRLRLLMALPREIPGWLAEFLRDAARRDWIEIKIVIVADVWRAPATRKRPLDLRLYLALERLRRRRSGNRALSRVEISDLAGTHEASEPGNTDATVQAALDAFAADVVMSHADLDAEAIAKRVRWGVWRFDDDLWDARASTFGLAPLLEEQLATALELELDFGAQRSAIAVGNLATQAGSFALQCEQIVLKLPSLLLGALRDLLGGRIDVPRNGAAKLRWHDAERTFAFGSGLRALRVSLKHTLEWRRRTWSGEDPWFLALRRAARPIDPTDPVIGEVSALAAPAGRYWADPCIVEYDGRAFVFVEEYSLRDGKGVIACLELLDDDKARRLGIALERAWHLSYPQVFESDGTWYMMVESGSVRRASLYRAAGFPLRWDLVGDLLSGCHCVDSTLYRQGDHWYLFAGVSESGGSTCDELFLFVADALTGPYRPHPSNSIVRDVRRARPAGRLFERDGRLIRPAQDCAPDYGAAIVLNEVLELTPTTYRERQISHIPPSWLPDLWGCHTYCAIDGIEVIDGRGPIPANVKRIEVVEDPILAHDAGVELPVVSALMPVYNGERFLAQAIESALAQTMRNVEIVVVDDGSTDSSGAIADRYAAANPDRVRVVHQPNAGLPLARNAAIAAAKGRYLALLDADDVWLPEHLTKCVEVLERDAEIGLVHADSDFIDANDARFTVEEEVRWGRDERDPYSAVLLRRQHIVCPTAVFRRCVVDRVGVFDPSFNRLGCEDRDMWLRIAETSRVVYIPGVHALYRVHDANMSANTERMWRARRKLVDKYAQRPRGKPLRRRALAAIDADQGHELAREPKLLPTLAAFMRALARDPLRLDAWKGLLRRVLVGRRPGAVVRR